MTIFFATVHSFYFGYIEVTAALCFKSIISSSPPTPQWRAEMEVAPGILWIWICRLASNQNWVLKDGYGWGASRSFIGVGPNHPQDSAHHCPHLPLALTASDGWYSWWGFEVPNLVLFLRCVARSMPATLQVSFLWCVVLCIWYQYYVGNLVCRKLKFHEHLLSTRTHDTSVSYTASYSL